MGQLSLNINSHIC